MIPSDLYRRKGFYQVGGARFLNKVPAVIEASRTGVFPQWIFMNDLIDAHDWKKPTELSLRELYRRRAQQLRERYDYLTLSYSGGADSDNVLRSFLDNNIRLDEILVVWPVKKSESRVADATDLSKSNYTSEWGLTIRPRLKWIADNYPGIKITVRDWGDELSDFSIKDDFLMQRGSMVSPYGVLRWHDRDRLDMLGRKNGCLIYGTDKPRLCIKDGWYHIYFLDIAVQANQPEIDAFSEMVELFYWSPDTLDLVCKQSHALVDFFESHPSTRRILDWPIKSEFHEQYRNIVKSIVYPGGYNLFQVNHFAYDSIVNDTDIEHTFQSFNIRAWENLRPLVQDRFLSEWDGQTQLIGMINGMWALRPVNGISIKGL